METEKSYSLKRPREDAEAELERAYIAVLDKFVEYIEKSKNPQVLIFKFALKNVGTRGICRKSTHY